jgi:hypothetical protein
VPKDDKTTKYQRDSHAKLMYLENQENRKSRQEDVA